MLDRRVSSPRAELGARRTTAQRIQSAAIWKTPRSFLAFILSVEALCVTSLVVTSVLTPIGASDWLRFALLIAINVVYAEGNARIERLSKFLGVSGGRATANAASLWCIAAALVLPVSLAGVFTLLLYGQVLLRAMRAGSSQPFRTIYTAATEIAATMTACAVAASFDGRDAVVSASPMALVAAASAVAVYTVVNQVLLVVAIYLAQRPTSLRSLIPDSDSQTMEVATLCLGVLFAVATSIV